MHDVTNLTIYSRFFKDIFDIAKAIEMECADVLLPAPKGIYVANRVNPVMVDGVEYYIIEKGQKKIVNDITHVTSRVYTVNKKDEEKCVIPELFMKNKKKYLSTEPIMPHMGVKIVEFLLMKQINDFLSYAIEPFDQDAIYEFFNLDPETITDSYVEAIDPYICAINRLYDPMYFEVKEFLGNHDWHLFFVRLDETRVRIEKSIDYRAYLYLEEKAT